MYSEARTKHINDGFAAHKEPFGEKGITINDFIDHFEKKFFDLYVRKACENMQHLMYGGGAIDFIENLEKEGSEDGSVLIAYPAKAPKEVLTALNWPLINIREDVKQKHVALLVVDYLNTIMMVSCPNACFSFASPTVGTGVELYMAFAAKCGQAFAGWDPEIHVILKDGDVLETTVSEMIAEGEMKTGFINFHSNVKEMYGDILSGNEAGYHGSLCAQEGITVLNELINRLKEKVPKRNGYYNLAGGGSILSPVAEPAELLIYAHRVLFEKGEFRFPDYQGIDIQVLLPYSEKQITDFLHANGNIGYFPLYSECMPVPGILDELTQSAALYANRFVPKKNILTFAEAGLRDGRLLYL